MQQVEKGVAFASCLIWRRFAWGTQAELSQACSSSQPERPDPWLWTGSGLPWAAQTQPNWLEGLGQGAELQRHHQQPKQHPSMLDFGSDP